MAELKYLDPEWGWWVTGLTDGEGCFYAGLTFRSKGTSSGKNVACVELTAEFSLGLRADDSAVIDILHEYFRGVGFIHRCDIRNCPSTRKYGLRPNPLVYYKVRTPKDLLDVVVPHFERFPLRTKKSRDFETWCRVLDFASLELLGHKGWLRRFPDKVAVLQGLCEDLKQGRAFAVPAFVGGGES
jgi:hypothetical protein